MKCEHPIDELTVQVWLLCEHPNFKYCTLFVRRTELRINGQTDGRTDGRMIQTLDDPGRPFKVGGIKIQPFTYPQLTFHEFESTISTSSAVIYKLGLEMLFEET